MQIQAEELSAVHNIFDTKPQDTSQTLPDLRAELRSATRDIHLRLHRHPGFAAVNDQTIEVARYTLLLRRLLGFHQAFEIATGLPPDRSSWLASDLAFLNDNKAIPARQPPCCVDIPLLIRPEEILGAKYVMEGSALGNCGLARQLDGLLGADGLDGRRFFSGNGADTGLAWGAYLARLASVSSDPVIRQRVVAAGTATFAAFEIWLRDWDI